MKNSQESRKEPPEGLSESSKALWASIVRTPISTSRGELLEQALFARDRLLQIREALAGQPLIVVTEETGAQHANPLIKMELETRRQFASIWGILKLGWRAEIDGRI